VFQKFRSSVAPRRALWMASQDIHFPILERQDNQHRSIGGHRHRNSISISRTLLAASMPTEKSERAHRSHAGRARNEPYAGPNRRTMKTDGPCSFKDHHGQLHPLGGVPKTQSSAARRPYYAELRRPTKRGRGRGGRLLAGLSVATRGRQIGALLYRPPPAQATGATGRTCSRASGGIASASRQAIDTRPIAARCCARCAMAIEAAAGRAND